MLKEVHLEKVTRKGITSWIIAFEFTDRENYYTLIVNDHLGWDGVAKQLLGLGNVIMNMWLSYNRKDK